MVVIHGGVPRDRRRAFIAAFNDDPAVRVLVANDAAGEGVNLQRGAHLMVNYDLPWNPNRLEQRFGRIHRIGQTEVCHLWNLVAAGTREGEVYGRLLEKLEEARRALGGRVYDVLGELLEATALRDLLMEAVRYGERPDVRARLFQVVDGAVDRTRIEALVRERKLTREGMDPATVAAIRADMERAEARRLQPRYVRAFFQEAFPRLGGDMRAREAGRFEITRTPSLLREHDRLTGRHDPVLERYARVCFDKAYVPGDPRAALLAPGHPLLDAVVNVTLERHRDELKRGAILIDDGDDGEQARLLLYLDHAVRDGRKGRNDEPLVISRRLQFVFLDARGNAIGGGAAPYLDYRPATEPERVGAASLAGRTLAGWGRGSQGAGIRRATPDPASRRGSAHPPPAGNRQGAERGRGAADPGNQLLGRSGGGTGPARSRRPVATAECRQCAAHRGRPGRSAEPADGRNWTASGRLPP